MRYAELPEEQAALQTRYEMALQFARATNCESVLQRFQQALSNSQAVMACAQAKLIPLANGHVDLYVSYERLRPMRFVWDPAPGKTDWNRLRQHAEIELFGRCDLPLHYAALSLNEQSVATYGECHVVLKEQFIADRTTTFEGNSAWLIKQWANTVPPGHRATWSQRAQHVIAKLGSRLSIANQDADFPSILLKSGPTGIDDEYVEIHVFGSMSVHTFHSVKLVGLKPMTKHSRRPRQKRGQTLNRAIQEWLQQAGVPVS